MPRSVEDDDLDLEALQRLSDAALRQREARRESSGTQIPQPQASFSPPAANNRESLGNRVHPCVFNSNVFMRLQQWVTVHLVHLKHSLHRWVFGLMGFDLILPNLKTSD